MAEIHALIHDNRYTPFGPHFSYQTNWNFQNGPDHRVQMLASERTHTMQWCLYVLWALHKTSWIPMFWPNYDLSPTWISLKHPGVPWNPSKKATRYQNWGVGLSSPTSLSNKLTRSEVIPSQLHLTLQLNSSNKLIKPSATDLFPSQMLKLEEGCCCWVFFLAIFMLENQMAGKLSNHFFHEDMGGVLLGTPQKKKNIWGSRHAS